MLTLSETVPMFTESYGKTSAWFASVASATFIGNAKDALCRLLQIPFRSGFREWIPKSVSTGSFEDRSNIMSISYLFELPWKTFYIWDILRAQRLSCFVRKTDILGINNGVMKRWG
jgi:hypothetical protein